MASKSAADEIMDGSRMKPLLALSKREPVSAAIGLTAEGEGIILLDKKVKPKKALAMMRALAGKAKLQLNPSTLRFGRAEVDADYDPGMVRFFVNKETPGNMRGKLVEVIRKAAFQKVEINVEESLNEEPEEDEAQAETAPAAAQPGPDAPLAPPPPPTHDASQLIRALKALVERVAALGDQAVRAALLKLANEAQGHLKANELPQAEQSIIALNRGLAAAQAGSQAKPSTEKLQAVWQTAKESIDGKLEQLARHLRTLDDQDANTVAEYGLFGLTTGGETVSLMKALTEYDAASGEARAKAATSLRAAAAAYRGEIEGSNLADLLDENPFGVNVGLRATLGAALQHIESAIA